MSAGPITPDAAPATTELAADVGHLAPLVVKEAKAGYKTTEFWLTISFVVLTQLQALHLPGKYGDTIGTVAAIAAYALSRGFAKAGVPNVVTTRDPAA